MTSRIKRIDKTYASAMIFFGLVCAMCFGAFRRAAASPQPQVSGSKLPDLAGFTTGMSPQQVYEMLKSIDPGHTVALTQTTIPQLYGDKPIMVGMNPATQDFAKESINVTFTLPPAPQVSWQVAHHIGQFTSTRKNVYNSLVQKYGPPWAPDVTADRYALAGLSWYFDDQGRLVSPPDGQALIAFKNCVGQFFVAASNYNDGGITLANDATTNIVNPGRARNAVFPLPPTWDPNTHPQCVNMIKLSVTVNANAPSTPDASGIFSMDFTMTAPTIQHRAFVTYNDAVNAVVAKGIQQQDNKAQQQAMPKF